ncbi:MAG: HD domain-containing protein [Patulibacter sp.]|nr:HD domain-containing protein [Patulibacter sp.]
MELRELEHGAPVDLVLLVREASRRSRPDSDEFLRLTLADRSQQVAAMVWDDVPAVAEVAVRGTAVRVVGRFEVHERYGRQIAIERIAPVAPADVDYATLVPGPDRPIEQIEQRFRGLIERTEDRWLRLLLERVFAADGAFWERFRVAPAAKHFHEAYPHGLLDHTTRVTEAVEALVPLFPGIDRDVAVAGALLHDIGKAQAYTTDPVAPDMTELGRLEGHIVIGYEIVRRVLAGVEGFPEQTARSVRHIVLSHHGKLDYGSPVVPHTREAALVHHVDDLAAQLGGFDRLQRELADGAQWSRFDRGVGGAAYFGPAREVDTVDPQAA